MVALVLALLCGTASGWGMDPLNCANEDLSVPQNIVKAKLYRAICGGAGMPALVDSLPAIAGVETCFSIPDTSVCATYWITAVNAAGLESCLGQGFTFPRAVGVGYPMLNPERKWEWVDAMGRRLPTAPVRRGVYWKREWVNGRWISRKIIVL